MNRETKNAPLLPVTPTDDATGSFEGYLAVFGNLDYNGDIIDRGAFTKTLTDAKAVQRRNKSPFLYPLLWQHNEAEPIGGITDAYEDAHGLYIKGRYDLNTELGRRAYSGAKMGYLPGLSIGYRTVKSSRDTKGERHLTEIQLFEGSVVTLPANASAMVTSVKARNSHRTDWSYSDAVATRRELEWKTAVMALEAKAVAFLASPAGAEFKNRQERTAEIDTERAKIHKAIAALSVLPDSGETLAQLRTNLAKLDHERDELNPRQAKWRAELRDIKERHALERKARARGERVPSIHGDPEAYVAWLQHQRDLPYIELARDLNEQNRRGM